MAEQLVGEMNGYCHCDCLRLCSEFELAIRKSAKGAQKDRNLLDRITTEDFMTDTSLVKDC